MANQRKEQVYSVGCTMSLTIPISFV